MNILIPHNWLLEYLDTKATPQQIADCLSLSGPSVERIETIKGEPVYDIEVTTNRVDAMSVYGIAREAAVILPESNIPAHLKPLNPPAIESSAKLDFTIKNDPHLCHRILAVKLSNVHLGPSNKRMQKRLEQVGQRPLNNAIDITNYVMWAVGHPIHVFDYDRLSRKTIIVRQAKKGERLVTLDGQTHTMVGGEVVFDDGTGTIVDLPGIMGTQNTVVTEKTQNILLWIESIDAGKIRFASMTHAIRTQAAVLNEKHVDSELGVTAIREGARLFKQLTHAQLASELVDIHPNQPPIKTCQLDQDLIDTYLGTHLKPTRITRILTGLGCQVKHSDDTYRLTPPSYRSHDLEIPQDYIEEIARIYGYHNLDSRLMATAIPDTPQDSDFNLEYQIKQWLAGWGANEVYTYSLVSPELAVASGYSLNDHYRVANPYSQDWVYLRRSLIPSLSQVLSTNPTHQTTVFELQNVYHPPGKPPFKKLPEQILTLTCLTNQPYHHLKGLLDALSDKLFMDTHVKPADHAPKPFIDHQSGEVISGSTKLGLIGRVAKDQARYAFELSFPQIRTVAHTHPEYVPLIDQPPIIEDMTFTLPSKTPIGPVINTIQSTSQIIESVLLKTIYDHNYTFTLTYRRADRPLTDHEIAPIRHKIVDQLKSQHINLVGTLEN